MSPTFNRMWGQSVVQAVHVVMFSISYNTIHMCSLYINLGETVYIQHLWLLKQYFTTFSAKRLSQISISTSINYLSNSFFFEHGHPGVNIFWISIAHFSTMKSLAFSAKNEGGVTVGVTDELIQSASSCMIVFSLHCMPIHNLFQFLKTKIVFFFHLRDLY